MTSTSSSTSTTAASAGLCGIDLCQSTDQVISTSPHAASVTNLPSSTSSGYTPLATLLNSATTNLQHIAIGSSVAAASSCPSSVNNHQLSISPHSSSTSSTMSPASVLTGPTGNSFHYVQSHSSGHPNCGFDANPMSSLHSTSPHPVGPSTGNSSTSALSMSGFATLFGGVDFHPSHSHHPMHHHQPRFNALSAPKMDFGPVRRPVLLRQNSAQDLGSPSSSTSDRQTLISRKLSAASDNGNCNEPCCCLWVQCNLVFGDQRELVSQTIVLF